MKRIGIMGGTFDPIHQGHLMIGKQAYEEYGLDCVWFMPSKTPPHKKDHPITSAEHRCAMVEAAIRPFPYFQLSDFELKRKEGNTYTADTLRLLKEEYPEVTFYFIVGADSIMDIEKWYRPDYVLQAVTFLAAERECEEGERTLEEQIAYLTRKYQANILQLHCREFDAASEEIRQAVAAGKAVDKLIPEAVLSYIKEHSLYSADADRKKEADMKERRRAVRRSCSKGPNCGEERCKKMKNESETQEQYITRVARIRKSMKKKLHPMRYEHTLGVAFTCIALAMRYGCDLEKAELAGLLHDCAKRYDDETILQKCEKHGVELTKSERKAPAVVHAKLGAWMAAHKYGVDDPEILDAIACHTTGKPAMELLDKILYVADYIEPRRNKAPRLPELRRLAFEDLDETLYQILEGTLQYLESTGGVVDEMTERAYEYYRASRTE